MQYFKIQAREESIALRVVFLFSVMATAIHFQNDGFFCTVKIDNIVANDLLSVKVKTEQLFFLELIPK